MKGDIRCVDGRRMRHDPQSDDPDLETDRGQCPYCLGLGCKSEKSDNLRTLPDPHGVLGIKEKMRQSLEDEDVLCISPSDLTKLLNDHDALTECVAYLTDAWPAARALLSEAEVWLAKGVFKHHTDDLLARIAAELEPKP